MGTEITLEVNGLTVDWSKNSRGEDHGMLFQERDRKPIPCDQADYEWYKKNGEDPTPMEMAFCKSLREVVPRLELLGFTLPLAEREYALVVEDWQELREIYPKEPAVNPLNFSEFCVFATHHSLESLDNTYIEYVEGKRERDVRGRFTDDSIIQRLPLTSVDTGWSERNHFGNLIGILHPYSVLRVLAENTTNLGCDITWQYGPLVQSGWAVESDFFPNARRDQTFLIATEGSSDAHILEHAFKLLRPEVSDFFRFIDVSERHPFPGTGNLLKFAEGLAKIDVQNQTIFLFDNDAEGYETYQKVLRLALPDNMRAMVLPDLDQFRSFPARGPGGVTNSDINRRAAAIECYLDLTNTNHPPAKVIWTNYKKEIDAYHGALEYKESYAKAFLKLTPEALLEKSYDVSKLQSVLNALITECTSIATSALQAADI